jgi:hypothetical protein
MFDQNKKPLIPVFDKVISRTGDILRITNKLLSKINLVPYRKKNGKFIFVDFVSMKPVLYRKEYDNAYSFDDNFAKVCNGEKFGLINFFGDEVISVGYDDIELYEGSFAAIRINDKWGLCDLNGNVVIPVIYDEIEPLKNGMCTVKVNHRIGRIDLKGNIVIPIQYREIFEMDFGNYLWVEDENNLWHILNKCGVEVTYLNYTWVQQFAADLVFVAVDGQWGLLNTFGKIILPIIHDTEDFDYVHRFSEGLFRVRVKSTQKWGFIDHNGELVIPAIYDSCAPFVEGLACVCLNSKCGFIDRLGNIIVPIIYENVLPYTEGLAAVKINDCYGFIDNSGSTVISAIFSYTTGFSGGTATVTLGNKNGLIDTTGKFIIQPIYQQIIPFDKNGLARVKLNGSWGLIDRTNTVILDLIYQEISNFSEGLAAIRLKNNWGYINISGKKITPNVFKIAGNFRDGFAEVDYDNKDFFPLTPPRKGFFGGVWYETGYIDTNGKLHIGDIVSNLVRGQLKWAGAFDKYGIIDKDDKVIIYYMIMSSIASESVFRARRKGGPNYSFYIDKTGREFREQ